MPQGLIARFRADLERVWPEGGRLGVAVSGGPDSLALLVLADQACAGRIEAATVDHGLRANSAAEAAFVAMLCTERGIPHETLTVEVPAGNVQDQARTVRYAALGGWMERRGLDALATAHHADDQAETLLMRLNRASGVAGLAGVRARGVVAGSDLPLLRPLLGWRRDDLAQLTAGAGIAPVIDPSNADARFDRVRIRQALNSADWLDVPSLAASAAHMADAADALDWAAQREWEEGVTFAEGGLLYRPLAPRAVRMRVLARIIAALGQPARGGDVARLLDALARGEAGCAGNVLAKSDGPVWRFTPEPPRRVHNSAQGC